MKYFSLLIFYTIALSDFSVAQKRKDLSHREVLVHKGDSSIKTTVLLKRPSFHPKANIQYHWYNKNSIQHNQGGFKGKLLDGKYVLTDAKGGLIQTGKFKKGVKSGKWKKWDAQGNLITITSWKRGMKNGAYQKYRAGTLTEKGRHRKNEMHGLVTLYQKNLPPSRVNYKNGKMVPPNTSSPSSKKKTSTDREKEEKEEKWYEFWKKDKKTSEKKVKKQKTRNA